MIANFLKGLCKYIAYFFLLLTIGIIFSHINDYFNNKHNSSLENSSKNNDMVEVRSIIGKMENIDKSKNSDIHNALGMSIGRCHPDIVQELINTGNDVNIVEVDGETLLMLASGYCSEVIESLIKAGADINARDIKGNTAIVRAIQRENVEAVRVLIKAGADISLKNNNGAGIMQIVKGNNDNSEIIRILKEAGVKE